MKKVILAIVCLGFLYSCGMSKEEQLVSDYEQLIEGTKIDLNLKVKESKLIGETFYADSIAELSEYIDFKVNEKIEQLGRIYQDSPDELESFVKLYRGDKKETFLEAPYKKLLFYQENPSKKIGEVWQMTYTINNPLLGGVEQELTKKYLINPEKTKIISTISE
jgi:hypothetical protein